MAAAYVRFYTSTFSTKKGKKKESVYLNRKQGPSLSLCSRSGCWNIFFILREREGKLGNEVASLPQEKFSD
jgi:hypothetical protein